VNGNQVTGLVLAPVPVAPGEDLCLFSGSPLSGSRWDVFNILGMSVARPVFTGPAKHCWNTRGIAPGMYIVRVKVTFADGGTTTIFRKVLVSP